MSISPELLEILRCPQCKSEVRIDDAQTSADVRTALSGALSGIWVETDAGVIRVNLALRSDQAPFKLALPVWPEWINDELAAKWPEHAARFPRVAASFGIPEIRRLARALIQQGAPFPIC